MIKVLFCYQSCFHFKPCSSYNTNVCDILLVVGKVLVMKHCSDFLGHFSVIQFSKSKIIETHF